MAREIIDVHTHIFNLNYLPIRGVIESYNIPSVIARGVEYILLSKTHSSDFNQYNKGFLRLENEAEDFSKSIDNLTEEEVAEDIAARIDRETFYSKEVQDALLEFQKEKSLELTKSINYSDELKDVQGDVVAENKFIFREIKALLRGFEAIRHYLKWFRFMMRSEETIYKNLEMDYGHIGTKVFHMMDPEYFFSGKPTLSIEKKIENMRYLLNKHKDKLIGFVPYNPKRDNHLEIVSNAVNNGFTGIKFYPPMGYRPAENDTNYEPEVPNIENGKLMDRRISKLFRHAVKNDIPIFTHCTPDGFEAIPGKSGKNCDPRFWKALLEQAEFSNLRLCLGHAGGAEGWFSKTEVGFVDSYAKGVYDLCTTYENVYCEVGFLADIKDKRLIPYFRKRLQHLFENDRGNFQFKKKIMFGSDWHILFNHGINKKYDRAFGKLFEAEILNEYLEEFFQLNAKDYLKL